MKRQEFRVSLHYADDTSYSEAVAYAHNSGIRKSEALVREFARTHGVMMHGDKPQRDESGYRRTWRSANGAYEVVASVKAE